MVEKEDGSICYKTLTSKSYIVLDPNTQMLMPWAGSMWGRLMKMKMKMKISKGNTILRMVTRSQDRRNLLDK